MCLHLPMGSKYITITIVLDKELSDAFVDDHH
jgi:hypothetical protein